MILEPDNICQVCAKAARKSYISIRPRRLVGNAQFLRLGTGERKDDLICETCFSYGLEKLTKLVNASEDELLRSLEAHPKAENLWNLLEKALGQERITLSAKEIVEYFRARIGSDRIANREETRLAWSTYLMYKKTHNEEE